VRDLVHTAEQDFHQMEGKPAKLCVAPLPVERSRAGGGDVAPALTAAGKVLAVLGAFSHARPALRLADLARITGLPLSTTHRLVAELVTWGALERDDGGAYRVGLRVWELGALAPRGLGLREAALPFMEDLYEVTHENVQLAVREETDVVFVERIAGHRAVPVLTAVGGRFPASATGVGLVLLAHAPPDVQERVLRTPIPRFSERTILEPAVLRRVLAEVRRSGFAVSNGQVTLDAVSVAAPITTPGGDVVAAVSIVVRGDGPSAVRPYTQLVQAAARGISRALAQ
jgi:DNA-binding IclR family transcriptional regulator